MCARAGHGFVGGYVGEKKSTTGTIDISSFRCSRVGESGECCVNGCLTSERIRDRWPVVNGLVAVRLWYCTTAAVWVGLGVLCRFDVKGVRYRSPEPRGLGRQSARDACCLRCLGERRRLSSGILPDPLTSLRSVV